MENIRKHAANFQSARCNSSLRGPGGQWVKRSEIWRVFSLTGEDVKIGDGEARHCSASTTIQAKNMKAPRVYQVPCKPSSCEQVKHKKTNDPQPKKGLEKLLRTAL